MPIVILLLPFLNFIIILVWGNTLGRFGSLICSIFSYFCSLLITSKLIYNLLLDPSSIIHIQLGNWFKLGPLHVNWGFLFDGLSLMMCLIILVVTLLVQIYSYGYMFSDPSLPRFFAYLALFVFFMLILVTADNFVVLFLGWEGVGLCSYLLISFWNTRVSALKAALKALVLNRIGDFFLTAAMALIYTEFNTLNFLSLYCLIPYYTNTTISFYFISVWDINLITCICFFLIIACFTKSAQVGLHAWLPDAMEGPTPVSALIHAATMVTAGVFVVIRCSFIFEFAPKILNLMLFFGAVTAVFASLCGIVETDLKKIIAYSTCSQLGYMFCACGLSSYNVAFFHLFNHAFFKALLFLSAGSIIHNLSGEQNISRMGALRHVLPLTYATMFIGLLSLTAFPFTSGFYSKEAIISIAYVEFGTLGSFVYCSTLLSAFLTSFYSYRLMYYVFFGTLNSHKRVIFSLPGENIFLTLPLVFLSFLSLFSGIMFKDVFIGFGSNFFDYSIFVLPENLKSPQAEFLPTYIKILPLIMSILGWGIFNPAKVDTFLKFRLINIYNLLKNEMFFNQIYNKTVISIYQFLFVFCYYELINLIQFFGPNGFFYAINNLARQVSIAHSGYLHNYLCSIFFSSLLILMFIAIFN